MTAHERATRTHKDRLLYGDTEGPHLTHILLTHADFSNSHGFLITHTNIFSALRGHTANRLLTRQTECHTEFYNHTDFLDESNWLRASDHIELIRIELTQTPEASLLNRL